MTADAEALEFVSRAEVLAVRSWRSRGGLPVEPADLAHAALVYWLQGGRKGGVAWFVVRARMTDAVRSLVGDSRRRHKLDRCDFAMERILHRDTPDRWAEAWQTIEALPTPV